MAQRARNMVSGVWSTHAGARKRENGAWYEEHEAWYAEQGAGARTTEHKTRSTEQKQGARDHDTRSKKQGTWCMEHIRIYVCNLYFLNKTKKHVFKFYIFILIFKLHTTSNFPFQLTSFNFNSNHSISTSNS